MVVAYWKYRQCLLISSIRSHHFNFIWHSATQREEVVFVVSIDCRASLMRCCCLKIRASMEWWLILRNAMFCFQNTLWWVPSLTSDCGVVMIILHVFSNSISTCVLHYERLLIWNLWQVIVCWSSYLLITTSVCPSWVSCKLCKVHTTLFPATSNCTLLKHVNGFLLCDVWSFEVWYLLHADFFLIF